MGQRKFLDSLCPLTRSHIPLFYVSLQLRPCLPITFAAFLFLYKPISVQEAECNAFSLQIINTTIKITTKRKQSSTPFQQDDSFTSYQIFLFKNRILSTYLPRIFSCFFNFQFGGKEDHSHMVKFHNRLRVEGIQVSTGYQL